MKKSTLDDALSVNQKLLDLAEKASGDEKKEIEKARETFCDLIVHLSGGIIQMGDAMDKQNDLIKKYQKALDIAAENYANDLDCGIYCPNWEECRGILSFEGCKQAILKEWKEAAGIE